MRHAFAGAMTAATLLGLFTPIASAQQVSLKPDLKDGDTMTYEMISTLRVTQTQNSATSTQNTNHNATLAFTVDSVNDDGSAEVSMTFDAIAISIEAGDASEAFSWSYNGGDRPDASMGEGINASGFALAGAEIAFMVDADGQVTNLTGLDEFLGTIEGESAQNVAYVGNFTPERLAAAIEPIFDADGGADEPREKGDKWTETERVDLGTVGAIVLERTYSYLHSANGMASILGTLRVKHEKPDNPPADAPSVELSGTQGAHAIQWDTRAGRLQQYGRNETMKTTWTMGDVTIEQMQRSVMSLERAE